MLLAGLLATAQAEDFSSLLNNSPFAPVAGSAAGGGDKSLEFRGLYTQSGATYFSIYDPATQRAAWVSLNESGHPFVVRGYNDSNDTVTVELNGHNLNLALKHAQVQLAAAPKTPVAAPGAGPQAQTPGEGGMRGRWMANMAGPDGRPDPERMRAFIEEMRQRRAARFQNQGPSPFPQPQGTAAPAAGGAGAQPAAANMPMPMPSQTGAVPQLEPPANPNQ